MPIDTVTLTGVDDSIRFADLRAFWLEYPATEFGILWSHKRQGKEARYPSLGYIKALIEMRRGKPYPPMALHVCDTQALTEFIENIGSVTRKLANKFNRVQLNLKENEINIRDLNYAIGYNPNQSVITQHNAYNPNLWSLIGQPNHEILFDASGGQGKLPPHWPSPFATGISAGYAGGLGPDNIEAELPKIEAAAGKGVTYWIDMESRLRDRNDRFDLNRADLVQKKVTASCLVY